MMGTDDRSLTRCTPSRAGAPQGSAASSISPPPSADKRLAVKLDQKGTDSSAMSEARHTSYGLEGRGLTPVGCGASIPVTPSGSADAPPGSAHDSLQQPSFRHGTFTTMSTSPVSQTHTWGLLPNEAPPSPVDVDEHRDNCAGLRLRPSGQTVSGKPSLYDPCTYAYTDVSMSLDADRERGSNPSRGEVHQAYPLTAHAHSAGTDRGGMDRGSTSIWADAQSQVSVTSNHASLNDRVNTSLSNSCTTTRRPLFQPPPDSTRALIQYEEPSVAAPNYSAASSARAYSYSGRGPSPTGGSELRAMLVRTERELADMREENAKRGMLLDTQRASLERERTNLQSARERHAAEILQMREEHEEQLRQLRDQLHVLKRVSETAMEEKSQAEVESAMRKKELLALLDNERAEKSLIMADYREQTETLIAEQGAEITSLRVALEKVKDEYDRLSHEHSGVLDVRDRLATQMEELRAQLELVRLEAGKRAKEVRAEVTRETEDLRGRLNDKEAELRRESAVQAEKQQELKEQLQCMQAKLSLQEEERQREYEGLKQAYRRDMEGLQAELTAAKGLREKQAEEYRKELEKASRNEEKVTQSLHQALEQLRNEKEAALAESYRQREEEQERHRAKMSQTQATLEALKREVVEERAARKDAESVMQVEKVRLEGLQASLAKTQKDMETMEVTYRARERAAERAHDQEVEELRAKLRGSSAEVAYAQQQLQQQAVEQRRLRDDLASATMDLQNTKKEHTQLMEQHQEELQLHEKAEAAREAIAERAMEQLREQKAHLEGEVHRLEQEVHERERGLQGAMQKLQEEHTGLANASQRARELKAQSEDLQRSLAQEREKNAHLLEERDGLQGDLNECLALKRQMEAAIQAMELRLQSMQRDQHQQNAAHSSELAEQSQRHKAEVAAVRLAADQLRGELTRARESAASTDGLVEQLREELGQVHRETALREGAMQDEMEDRKAAHEEEMRHMDDLLNALRRDLVDAQATRDVYQREVNNIHQDANDRLSELAGALDRSEAARTKLQEDARYREELNQELQGTVRLLTARLNAHEGDVKRLHEELAEVNRKVHDAHTLIGRKDASIGQLNAKLRAYESRGGSL